mmetsp:Transcript_11906/g.30299  ORF Transcript_11906/g.30299 Transcript_11906/m.30299 type:complete len:116 (+) Transcript_11906:40-387(+)
MAAMVPGAAVPDDDAASELGDVFGDSDSDSGSESGGADADGESLAGADDLGAGPMVTQNRELLALEERLRAVGFHEGMDETYNPDADVNEAAFDEGFCEGFRQALRAGSLLGELR